MNAKETVFNYLSTHGGCYTVQQLAKRINLSASTIRFVLNQLRKEGKVDRYLGAGSGNEWYA
jgi:predicted transcriptional regulator